MKRFLAIYIGTKTALDKAQWEKLDDKTRRELEASGVKAWMEWGIEIMECLPLPGHKAEAQQGCGR